MSGDKSVKLGCVVQGDIRRGTAIVLDFMRKHFDVLILSTWRNSQATIPTGNFHLLELDPPLNPGVTHRNYQRYGVSRGVELARSLGCTHILKWRTDLLPIGLETSKLLAQSRRDLQAGLSDRIVTCAFRNLTVVPDDFSSIPDLFAFGSIDMIEMLWGDHGFDYSADYNVTTCMKNSLPADILAKVSGVNYCAESELYAHFKCRLQSHLNCSLTHPEIVLNHFTLIDDSEMQICWFNNKAPGFRSINQAYHLPWWTRRAFESGKYSIIQMGYPESGLKMKLLRLVSPILAKINEQRQLRWFKSFSSDISSHPEKISNTTNDCHRDL
jgi:hypothetical protein